MEPLTKKAALLSAFAAFSLIFAVLFPLLAGLSRSTIAEAPDFVSAAIMIAKYSWPSVVAAVFFLSAITFLALLGASLLFVIAPLMPVSFALSFWYGLPIGLLLFSFGGLTLMLYGLKVHRSAANRVRLHLPEVIRLPLTAVFVAVFAVGTFAAPALSEQILSGLMETMIKAAPATTSQGGVASPMGDQTVRDLIEAETAKRIDSCGGLSSCEEALRAAVRKEALTALRPADNAAEFDEEAFLDQPLSAVYQQNLSAQINNDELTKKLTPGGGAVWSLVLFLILSPFALLVSGIVTLLTMVAFQGLVAAGFLEIRQLPVRQDAVF